MPDVREVFQMSTQKVKPDPGFVDRQHDHQNKHERNRKVGAFVVVAAMALAAVVVIASTRPEGNGTGPADAPSSQVFTPDFVTPFLLDLGTGSKTSIPGDIGGGVFYTPSPDGTKLVFGHCCTSQDVVTIADIDGTDPQPVTPTDGLDGYGPAWSPDGTQLVYQLRDNHTSQFGSLIVEDVATGETTKLATIQGSNDWWFMSPSFSPDGRSVLFHVPRPSSDVWDVWSVPVIGGEPTRVLTNAKFARYFPDGKQIAFVSGRSTELEGPRISIASADGSRRTLVGANVSIFRPSTSPDGTRIAYNDGGSIYVVDVSTGESTDMGFGRSAEWLDDGTLIVSP